MTTPPPKDSMGGGGGTLDDKNNKSPNKMTPNADDSSSFSKVAAAPAETSPPLASTSPAKNSDDTVNPASHCTFTGETESKCELRSKAGCTQFSDEEEKPAGATSPDEEEESNVASPSRAPTSPTATASLKNWDDKVNSTCNDPSFPSESEHVNVHAPHTEQSISPGASSSGVSSYFTAVQSETDFPKVTPAVRNGSHHAAPGDRHQGLKTVPPTPGHGDGTPTDRLGLENLKSPVKDSQLKTPKKQFVSPPTSDVSMNVHDESPKVDGDDSSGKAETPSIDGTPGKASHPTSPPHHGTGESNPNTESDKISPAPKPYYLSPADEISLPISLIEYPAPSAGGPRLSDVSRLTDDDRTLLFDKVHSPTPRIHTKPKQTSEAAGKISSEKIEELKGDVQVGCRFTGQESSKSHGHIVTTSKNDQNSNSKEEAPVSGASTQSQGGSELYRIEGGCGEAKEGWKDSTEKLVAKAPEESNEGCDGDFSISSNLSAFDNKPSSRLIRNHGATSGQTLPPISSSDGNDENEIASKIHANALASTSSDTQNTPAASVGPMQNLHLSQKWGSICKVVNDVTQKFTPKLQHLFDQAGRAVENVVEVFEGGSNYTEHDQHDDPSSGIQDVVATTPAVLGTPPSRHNAAGETSAPSPYAKDYDIFATTPGMNKNDESCPANIDRPMSERQMIAVALLGLDSSPLREKLSMEQKQAITRQLLTDDDVTDGPTDDSLPPLITEQDADIIKQLLGEIESRLQEGEEQTCAAFETPSTSHAIQPSTTLMANHDDTPTLSGPPQAENSGPFAMGENMNLQQTGFNDSLAGLGGTEIPEAVLQSVASRYPEEHGAGTQCSSAKPRRVQS